MPRLLLDANMPKGLRNILTDREVVTAFQMGWGALVNSDLLAAAEAAGFAAILTDDKNLACQQNLAGRKLTVIVLSTNHWPTVRAQREAIMAAVNAAGPGSYTEVALTPPALRRRPPPSASPVQRRKR